MTTVQRDLSSLSNPHEIRVTHLDWEVKVDFFDKAFRAVATYTIYRESGSTTLQLDTAHLVVEAVKDATTGEYLTYKEIKGNKPHLGTQLSIELASTTTKVAVYYRTTSKASAIQWLSPAQTAGKKHPYLFTQCQAIHARSMLPCQDQPGVKMTYEVRVSVPPWATCVMSAVLDNVKEEQTEKVFTWKQKIPISSYLLAMAVGELAKRDISERCAVYSEPAMVEVAANEFAQMEDFLKIAEVLAGMPYVWGRYDLLCLPPSFPYGGMENPCLTFVTPTLLAGDRSLADVVAHEIAHSWTGNLVTNATWDHFWLNEGWTRWFDRKIMARIHKNDKYLDFDALGGLRDLEDTVTGEMPEKFQSLVLPIGDEDPDDAYSTVAYEKGFNFLMSLERRVGTPEFEIFFKAYVKKFAKKTLTSDDFKSFFMDHFQGNVSVNTIDWDSWFYSPGMPPESLSFDHSLAEASEKLAKAWVAYDQADAALPTSNIDSWSSQQTVCFLDNLMSLTASQPLQVSTLAKMNEAYNFAQSQNAEILFRFCQVSIASEDESMQMVIMHFISSQGRMKYVRPLYRALYASKMGKSMATYTFLTNKDFYHPICAKMIASDLMLSKNRSSRTVSMRTASLGVLAAVAFSLGALYLRRR